MTATHHPNEAERPLELTDAGSTRSAFHAWDRLLHRGALAAFGVSVLGAALGFGAHVLVARVVGKADYGIYALMLTWVSVLAVVAQAGQDNSVVRFLPTYALHGDWRHARGLRWGIGGFVLVVSTVVALAGCAAVAIVGREQTLQWRLTFYIGFASLPLLAQLQQSGAMHRAFKRAGSSGAYNLMVRPAVLIGTLGVLILILPRVDAAIAAAVNLFSIVVALIISAGHLSLAWPHEARGAPAAFEWRTWIGVGAKMAVLSWVIVTAGKLDVLVVGALLGTEDVGPYYAAVQIAGFAFYAFQAVNVILAPMIAERYDAGDLTNLESIVRKAARMGFAGALAASVFFALIGRWVLELFGAGFAPAYFPLLILLAGYSAVTLIGSGGFVLSMTKYQNAASAFAAIGLSANVALTLLLVPPLGIVGAAIAASLSLVLWHGLALHFVRTRVGINSAVVGRLLTSGVDR